MTDNAASREAREKAMRAIWDELDRQCGIGAGHWSTCKETGLMVVEASLDPFGLADAMLALADEAASQPREGWRMVPSGPTEEQIATATADISDRADTAPTDQAQRGEVERAARAIMAEMMRCDGCDPAKLDEYMAAPEAEKVRGLARAALAQSGDPS